MTTETEAAAGEEALPFVMDKGAIQAFEDMSPAERRVWTERNLPTVQDPDILAVVEQYEDVSGQIPLIGKDALVGQPFVMFSVSIVEGAATKSEHADDLVFVLGQAVKVTRDDPDDASKVTIREAGIHFAYNAGDTESVHGREALSVMETASPGKPVMCSYGLSTRTAAEGEYYTLRPEAAKYEGSLFPEA